MRVSSNYDNFLHDLYRALTDHLIFVVLGEINFNFYSTAVAKYNPTL